jgi:hypothetical protein
MGTVWAYLLGALLVVIVVACLRMRGTQRPPLLKEYPTSIGEILAQPKDVDILIALHQRTSQKWAASGFRSITEAERIVLCVENLEGEVNNGGFDQYFFNSEGELPRETPAALEAIGAVPVSGLWDRAAWLHGELSGSRPAPVWLDTRSGSCQE